MLNTSRECVAKKKIKETMAIPFYGIFNLLCWGLYLFIRIIALIHISPELLLETCCLKVFSETSKAYLIFCHFFFFFLEKEKSHLSLYLYINITSLLKLYNKNLWVSEAILESVINLKR